jgi:hypothetical protein
MFFFGSSGFLNQQNTGIKHHQTNKQTNIQYVLDASNKRGIITTSKKKKTLNRWRINVLIMCLAFYANTFFKDAYWDVRFVFTSSCLWNGSRLIVFCVCVCMFSYAVFCVLLYCLIVFNTTFNNISVISWRAVLLMEETEGRGENHRPVASHW